MSDKQGKLDRTIYVTTSTSDYVIINSSGNYTANFIDDETIEKYKVPKGSVKKKSNRKKK